MTSLDDHGGTPTSGTEVHDEHGELGELGKLGDGAEDVAGTEGGERDGEDRDGERPPTWAPPPSPAYAEPPPTVIRYRHTDTVARREIGPGRPGERRDGDQPAVAARSARRGGQLLLAGSTLVLAAVGTVVAVVVAGGGDPGDAFGEIAAVRGHPIVVPAGEDGEARPLEVGDTVELGAAVELPGEASVTVELEGGGVARFDSGARVTVADPAASAPPAGDGTAAAGLSIEVQDGRAWVNPGPGGRVAVRLPGATATTDGNPVAVDCTRACALEAPAGGVALTAGTGPAVTPAAGEVVTLARPGDATVAFPEEASPWARRNLDADAEAGLPDPQPGEGPGIRAGAVLDGELAVSIEVVGAPTGDPIPEALRYGDGETYALELTADGGACTEAACRVAVTAPEGATGNARVAGGAVELTLSQPIDCYDETYTSVVVPGIGTTSVTGTLTVSAVVLDGDRWRIDELDGTGTVAATLAQACNAGDVLGTSTSPVRITVR